MKQKDKIILSFIVAACFVFIYGLMRVEAGDSYTLTDEDVLVTNGEITNYWYTGGSPVPTDIIIPTTLDGQTVTRIGSGAFNSKGLTSVKMPDSVTEISSYAFYNNSLTSVHLPCNLASIGFQAFYKNPLTSITLPTPTRIGMVLKHWSGNGTTYSGGETVSTDGAYTTSWDYIMCTITMDEMGGTEAGDITYAYGVKLYSSNAPYTSKLGYVFGGWYEDDQYTTPVAFPYNIAGDDTWYAKWTANQYDVTFNSNGGSAVSGITNADYNTIITEPTAPTKTGYSFGGWYKERNLTTAWDFDTDTVSKDLTLYAKWTIKTFTISIEEMGGSSVDDITRDYGTTIDNMYFVAIPAKAGHTFAGWYKDDQYNAPVVFPYTVRGDDTWYAKWTANQYDVTFNSNGGSAVSEITDVDEDTTITEPEAPTKTGCSFSGWYKDDTLTTAWDFNIDTVTTDVTLYAKWTIKTFTISIEEMGGSSVDDITRHYDTTIDNMYSVPIPTKEGYTFAGWYKDDQYNTPVVFPYMVRSDDTWYAKWAAVSTPTPTYTVVFNSSGGSAVSEITDVDEDTTITEPVAPTKTGCSFSGWYKDDTLTTVWDFNIDTVTTDVTLYAKWTVKALTISIDEMGGSSVDDITRDYNTTIDNMYSVPTPTKEGHTFAGWYKDDQYNTPVVFPYTARSDDTWYAKWAAVSTPTPTYTVVFNSNGGSAVSKITDVDENTIITKPIVPTKKGYRFSGWYRDDTLTTVWHFATDTVTKDTTLYAKWIRVSSGSSSSGNKKNSTVRGYTGEGSFNVGKKQTTYSNGQKEITISVDEKALDRQVNKVVDGSTISIPIAGNTTVATVEFNVQDVKNMQEKELVLKVKTDHAAYELPTHQIDVEAISMAIGEDIELKDIKFSVEISRTNGQMATVVKNSTEGKGLSVVVPPVNFEIEASYKDKNCKVEMFNSYVPRTIEIPEGIDTSKITTAIITETDGSIRHVPTYVTCMDGKYYATINALTNSTYTLIYNEVTFADVTDSHWAKADIEKMASRLVVEGKVDDLFMPSEAVTRAELSKILVKALGLKPVEVDRFTDVESGTEIAGYIGTAYSYGIIKDTSETTFNPNSLVTRQDAMTMIFRMSKVAGFVGESSVKDVSTYEDYGEVSDYAKESIVWNVNNGIIVGKSEMSLAPFDNITIAELSVVTNRFLMSAGLID